MSTVVNPTTPIVRNPLPDGGFDIQGIEEQANRLEGTENGDQVGGGNLDDLLSGFDGADTIAGGTGNDGLSGGTGNDQLSGEEGNDTINAGSGQNIITGGDGDDRLIAENGGSTLTGGAGKDTFQFNFTRATASSGEPQSLEELGITISEITDFAPGEDKILIQGLKGTEAPIYNKDTGVLSLDDVEIVQLAANLNISEDDIEIAGNKNPVSIVSNEEAVVSRFYNPEKGVHFYTADEAEKNNVEQNLPNYNSEGSSYRTVDPLTGGQEVYRFFNPSTGVHLYTTNEVERDAIIETSPNFKFEGVKFYAYETPVEGSIPVYRFYEPTKGVHFYTPNEAEKNAVQKNLTNYSFEGIAYYALPVDESAGEI
ncbi:MAG: hypothetical protein ACRDBG_13335 [Waterburya sp.]